MGPLSLYRPSHQSWTLWPAYMYQVLAQLLHVVADSSAQTQTHTRSPDTHLCTAEANDYGNSGASHDPGKSKMSMLLTLGGKKTVWESDPDTGLSVFPESCPDHPGKYKRANPFQVESMTWDCHINQRRPSPAQAGNTMGVVGGSTVRFFGEDYGLRHTAGRLKLHFSLPLRGGLGCLEATHILCGPFSPWNGCNSASAFFTWGQLFLIWQKQFDKTWWEIQFFFSFFFLFLPMEEWKDKEREEGIVKSPHSPKDHGKERAVCPLLALFFSPSFLLLFSLASGDVKKCLLISSDRAWAMWRGWLVGLCQSMQGKNVPNKRVIS